MLNHSAKNGIQQVLLVSRDQALLSWFLLTMLDRALAKVSIACYGPSDLPGHWHLMGRLTEPVRYNFILGKIPRLHQGWTVAPVTPWAKLTNGRRQSSGTFLTTKNWCSLQSIGWKMGNLPNVFESLERITKLPCHKIRKVTRKQPATHQ